MDSTSAFPIRPKLSWFTTAPTLGAPARVTPISPTTSDGLMTGFMVKGGSLLWFDFVSWLRAFMALRCGGSKAASAIRFPAVGALVFPITTGSASAPAFRPRGRFPGLPPAGWNGSLRPHGRANQIPLDRPRAAAGGERDITQPLFIEVVTSHEKKKQQYRGSHGGFVYLFTKQIAGRELHIAAEVHKDDCYFVTGFWT